MFLNILPLVSLFTFISLSFFKINNNKNNLSTLTLFCSSILSILLLFFWFINNNPIIIINISWLSNSLASYSLSFIGDLPSVIFSAVSLIVTWSIIEFAHYYMNLDPNKNAFMNTLIFFLFFMLLLVTSNNLFTLFIGWEGVGILSFILIGWWHSRADANSAALQAIIYNRLGDSGFILFMGFTILYYNSWNFNEINIFNNSSPITFLAILGIILAASGKSAQFGLHPWLPAAMEGPTPVSALLHSSTMVVAGIFLLFRSHNLFLNSTWAFPIISIIGGITALFAATVAITQFDLKKIIAYSTTSQLGLMAVAIGLGIPQLALFHICTHAFFKALLFLCSGSIIHNFNNEQDLRKIGSSTYNLPFTVSCITIGSLALSGIPFLAGFYSKDLILEASQNSITNSISVLLSLIATFLTAIYSIRIIIYLSANNNSLPINISSEENHNLFSPLLRLTFGVLLAGWFFSISIFNFPPLILPWINKGIPLIITIYGFLLLSNISFNNHPTNYSTLNFLNKNWEYVNIIHAPLALLINLSSIIGVLRTLDQGWTSLLGPHGITNSLINFTNLLKTSQSGNIFKYILITLLIVSTSLILI